MNYFLDKIDEYKRKAQYRAVTIIESAQEPEIFINGKKHLLFASNNYLGLSNDNRVKDSAKSAIDNFGVGTGASRLVSGTTSLHSELERKIAKLKNMERALVLSSGYLANIAVISSICNKDFTVFSDRLNHSSIIDGIKLSGAKMVRYKHCDMKDLKSKLELSESKYKMIITDGVFSMDGDIAPLKEIVELSKEYDSLTMVDDAHATGVIGEKGSGSLNHLGIGEGVDIITGTFSKAFGSEGGFISASSEIIDYITNTARPFIFSTALSAPNTAAAIEAMTVSENDDSLRDSIRINSEYLVNELSNYGFNIPNTETPIIPVIIGSSENALKISSELLEKGIYIPAIRPPTVPRDTSRLRITIMSTHTKEQIDYMIKSIVDISKRLGII